MLVLTRKHNEKIVIGDEGNEIVITILQIKGSEKVSIGIQARSDTPIFREELLKRGICDRKNRIPSRKKASTTSDIDLLMNVVQAAEEKQEQEENRKSSQEYNCYLP